MYIDFRKTLEEFKTSNPRQWYKHAYTFFDQNRSLSLDVELLNTEIENLTKDKKALSSQVQTLTSSLSRYQRKTPGARQEETKNASDEDIEVICEIYQALTDECQKEVRERLKVVRMNQMSTIEAKDVINNMKKANRESVLRELFHERHFFLTDVLD